MTEHLPTSTLRQLQDRLMDEAAKIQPMEIHSCEYCTQLTVTLPDAYPPHTHGQQESVDAPVTGLSASSILRAAQSDCPLFAPMLDATYSEQDIDEELFLETVFDYNGERRYNERYPTKKAWNAYFLEHRYHLSIGEDSTVPTWLHENRPWRSSPATAEAFATARGWLEQCHEHCLSLADGTFNLHKSCKPVSTTFVPSRLVRVPDIDATALQIVETKDLGYVPWCSLSYCWGGVQRIKTTSTNFSTGERMVQISDLPQTIMDAILVASNLKIGYLWVDSLCILQDDTRDMQKELASMAKMYEHSLVTLVAASASTVLEGFLGPRDLSKAYVRPPVQLRCQTESGAKGSIMLHDLDLNEDTHVDPLDRRGWALQERLLSPRTLVYGSKTLRWACLSRSYRDSELHYPVNAGLGYVSRGAAMFYGNMGDIWKHIVEQYTERRLTFDDDRLIALAAVAERYNFWQGNYLAGLWRDELSSTWMWLYETTSGNRRPKKFRAPSWSWASIISAHPVCFKFTHPRGLSIIDAEVKPRIPSIPYGDARSGFMIVKCQLAWLYLKRDAKTSGLYLTAKEEDDKNIFRPYYYVSLDAPDDDFYGWNGPHKIVHRVWLLGSFSTTNGDDYGMLLKRVRGRPDTYFRVGACKISRLWKAGDGLLSSLNTADYRAITIE